MVPLMKSVRHAGVGAMLLAGVCAAEARVVEDVIDLPVQVADASGQVVRHRITVTIFREDTRKRSPFLILNHGRAVRAEDRHKLRRVRYSDNARYFVSKGFAVFVPTRVGYGVTSGPDVEHSGACRTRNYPPVYEAAAQQSIKVIGYAKGLPYVDPTKGLVVGQSFGGMTAITLAAKNIGGVTAAVNFAGGGGGGDPERRTSARKTRTPGSAASPVAAARAGSRGFPRSRPTAIEALPATQLRGGRRSKNFSTHVARARDWGRCRRRNLPAVTRRALSRRPVKACRLVKSTPARGGRCRR